MASRYRRVKEVSPFPFSLIKTQGFSNVLLLQLLPVRLVWAIASWLAIYVVDCPFQWLVTRKVVDRKVVSEQGKAFASLLLIIHDTWA